MVDIREGQGYPGLQFWHNLQAHINYLAATNCADEVFQDTFEPAPPDVNIADDFSDAGTFGGGLHNREAVADASESGGLEQLNLENELVAAEPSINPPYSKSPRCAAMITDPPDFGRFHSKYITGHVDRVSRSAKPLP